MLQRAVLTFEAYRDLICCVADVLRTLVLVLRQIYVMFCAIIMHNNAKEMFWGGYGFPLGCQARADNGYFQCRSRTSA